MVVFTYFIKKHIFGKIELGERVTVSNPLLAKVIFYIT